MALLQVFIKLLFLFTSGKVSKCTRCKIIRLSPKYIKTAKPTNIWWQKKIHFAVSTETTFDWVFNNVKQCFNYNPEYGYKPEVPVGQPGFPFLLIDETTRWLLFYFFEYCHQAEIKMHVIQSTLLETTISLRNEKCILHSKWPKLNILVSFHIENHATIIK